jgi:hypothetical protein
MSTVENFSKSHGYSVRTSGKIFVNRVVIAFSYKGRRLPANADNVLWPTLG